MELLLSTVAVVLYGATVFLIVNGHTGTWVGTAGAVIWYGVATYLNPALRGDTFEVFFIHLAPVLFVGAVIGSCVILPMKHYRCVLNGLVMPNWSCGFVVSHVRGHVVELEEHVAIELRVGQHREDMVVSLWIDPEESASWAMERDACLRELRTRMSDAVQAAHENNPLAIVPASNDVVAQTVREVCAIHHIRSASLRRKWRYAGGKHWQDWHINPYMCNPAPRKRPHLRVVSNK